MSIRLPSPDAYTIGWIAVLPIERAAAQALLDECHDPPDGFVQNQSDTNSYTWGRMLEHNIVIASLPAGAQGLAPAATTASCLLSSLPQVRIGLLVGIGGGIARPDLDRDIRLGDVAVGCPAGITGGVIQYDYGKAKSGQKWERKGSLNKPPAILLSALSSLQAKHEITPSRIPKLLKEMWTSNPQMTKSKGKSYGYIHQGFEKDRLFKSTYDHTGGNTCAGCDTSHEIVREERDSTDPEVHYGIIASGNTLVKDAATRDALSQVVEAEECICVEMEAAGLVDTFPCLVVRGICDYADSHKGDQWQRYASATAAAFAKELLEFLPVRQVQAASRVVDILESMNQEIEKMQVIVESTKTEIQDLRTVILNADQRLILGQLRVAVGATFNSHAQEHAPVCLGDTRSDLLAQIRAWVGSRKPIFWLNGMAGTGKSTISRTIANSLSRKNELGGSFFFKRGEADRANLSKFVTTLAHQLSAREPSIAAMIKEAVDADPTLLGTAIRTQFKKLIMEPLVRFMELRTSRDSLPLIILIDALDECERAEDIELVINLLSQPQLLQFPLLKIFFTSRPERVVRQKFSIMKEVHKELVLHEISTHQIRYDISTFLQSKLEQIRDEYNVSVVEDWRLLPDWPGKPRIQALLERSMPLFISAATSCRFISDRRSGDPDTQLQKLLDYADSEVHSQLDLTYAPVLNQQIFGLSKRESEEVGTSFRYVVGTIITLASPLPTLALAHMLGISQRALYTKLDMLHSVFHIPIHSSNAPIRLLHLSFRNFLVNTENGKEEVFHIHEQEAHKKTAENCLHLMGGLKADLCNLQYPGTLRSIIEPEQVDRFLPAELRYSCLYWVFHVKQAGESAFDEKRVYEFLISHFLHWLEMLSLVGRASESLQSILTLQSCITPNSKTELSEFLRDAVRFIRAYLPVIDETPLQLYSSLIGFTPEQSIIRVAFDACKPRWTRLWPRTRGNWNPIQQTLEGHRGRVRSAVFSHDSKLIVSGAEDGTMRIWRVDTGECINILDGHKGWIIRAVGISHDSTFAISGSDDKTIRVWRVETGECTHIFEGHEEPVFAVAFSRCSELIASGSNDGTVRIWHVGVGLVHIFRDHSSSVQKVAFSHDSQLIFSGCSNNTVKIRHIETGLIRIFEGNARGAIMAFSPDSRLIASTSPGDAIRIWRSDTGECQKDLAGHYEFIQSLSFSHDSALILSASLKNVRIWEVETGHCMRTFECDCFHVCSLDFSHSSDLITAACDDNMVRVWRANSSSSKPTVSDHGHRYGVQYITFSADHRLMISSSYGTTVMIWDTETMRTIESLRGHTSGVNMAVFSSDAILIASASSDRAVRLWHTKTATCLQTLQGHKNDVYAVSFSKDSTLLASNSSDNTIRIWRTDTGKCIQILEGYGDWANPVAFSPGDPSLLASGCSDGSVQIWCAEKWHRKLNLSGHRLTLVSIAFSPSSTLIASASKDGSLRLWDTSTGECLSKVDVVRHTRYLSFLPGASYLMTDFGAIYMPGLTSTNSHLEGLAGEQRGYGISRDSSWITWNGRNLLWLPVEYRPSCSAISGSTVAIGCASGKVFSMEFAYEELPDVLRLK